MSKNKDTHVHESVKRHRNYTEEIELSHNNVTLGDQRLYVVDHCDDDNVCYPFCRILVHVIRR